MAKQTKPGTYIDQMVAPLVRRGIPWATTYGNHDSEIHLDPAQIFDHEKRFAPSLTRKMVSEPDAGISNYYLPVYPRKGDGAPGVVLWFFDSRGGHYPLSKSGTVDSVPRGNWVHASVGVFAPWVGYGGLVVNCWCVIGHRLV